MSNIQKKYKKIKNNKFFVASKKVASLLKVLAAMLLCAFIFSSSPALNAYASAQPVATKYHKENPMIRESAVLQNPLIKNQKGFSKEAIWEEENGGVSITKAEADFYLKATSVRYPGQLGSPSDWEQYYKNASGNSAKRVLPVERWRGVFRINSPKVGIIGANQFTIEMLQSASATFLFSIAVMIVYIISSIITIAAFFSGFNKSFYYVDFLFAEIGQSLFNNGDSKLLGATSIVMFIVVLALIIFLVRSLANSNVNLAKNLLKGMFFLALLSFTVNASAANHSSTSSRSISTFMQADSATQEQIVSSPSSWQPGSAGWYMSIIHDIGNSFNGIIGHVTGTAIETTQRTINKTKNQSATQSGCIAYTSAMYDIYNESYSRNTVSTGLGAIVESFSRLNDKVILQPYMLAAYGNTESAQNSWCRSMEISVNAPTGEQVFIAKKANLYKEIIEKVEEVNWRPGSEEAKNYGYFRAISMFGPSFPVPSNGDFFDGAMAASMYFAACNWEPGGSVFLNPEWEGVTTADHRTKKISKKYCLAVLYKTGDENNSFAKEIREEKKEEQKEKPKALNIIVDVFRTAVYKFKQGDEQSNTSLARDTEWGLLNEDVAPAFRYADFTGSLGYVLSTHTLDSARGKFMTEGITTSSGEVNPAFSFYSKMRGQAGNLAHLFSLFALVSAILIGRYILPLVCGLFIARSIAIVAAILAPLVLLTMIIPNKKSEEIGKKVFTSIVFSAIASGVFTFVLGIAIIISNILEMTLHDPGHSPFLQNLEIMLSLILALFTINLITKKIFKVDFKDFRKSAVAAGSLSFGNNYKGLFSDEIMAASKPFVGRGEEKRAARRSEINEQFSRFKKQAKDGKDRFVERRIGEATDYASQGAVSLLSKANSLRKKSSENPSTSVNPSANQIPDQNRGKVSDFFSSKRSEKIVSQGNKIPEKIAKQANSVISQRLGINSQNTGELSKVINGKKSEIAMNTRGEFFRNKGIRINDKDSQEALFYEKYTNKENVKEQKLNRTKVNGLIGHSGLKEKISLSKENEEMLKAGESPLMHHSNFVSQKSMIKKTEEPLNKGIPSRASRSSVYDIDKNWKNLNKDQKEALRSGDIDKINDLIPESKNSSILLSKERARKNYVEGGTADINSYVSDPSTGKLVLKDSIESDISKEENKHKIPAKDPLKMNEKEKNERAQDFDSYSINIPGQDYSSINKMTEGLKDGLDPEDINKEYISQNLPRPERDKTGIRSANGNDVLESHYKDEYQENKRVQKEHQMPDNGSNENEKNNETETEIPEQTMLDPLDELDKQENSEEAIQFLALSYREKLLKRNSRSRDNLSLKGTESKIQRQRENEENEVNVYDEIADAVFYGAVETGVKAVKSVFKPRSYVATVSENVKEEVENGNFSGNPLKEIGKALHERKKIN